MFKYSREEDTPAAKMEGHIDEEVKIEREKEAMLTQLEVSREINKAKVGRTYKVLIENKNKDYYMGRSYEMAPEIDGEVFIKGSDLDKGKFYNVEIIEALDYDLIGVVKDEFSK